MPYQLPSETGINLTRGADQFFVYLNQQVPLFMPMLFFALFMIVALGGYLSELRRQGFSFFAYWCTVGGVVTTVLMLMIMPIDGMVNNLMLEVSFIITAFCGIWFFMTKDRL